jgi:pyridoxine 5-phosphate synthase
VVELRALLREYPGAEFNIEGNPFHDLLEIVRETLPDQCTLVPDDPAAFTSDHGWNLQRDGARLKPLVTELKSLGIRVSLFMDPDADQIALAKPLGADRVELYTEPYARAFATSKRDAVTRKYADAARIAPSIGLGVNAGHDLNRDNLPHFLATVPGVLEVSIGHALIADALEFGLDRTVRLYLEAIAEGSKSR